MEDDYDFVLVNFANLDVLGHTGNLPACIRALESIDICIGHILEKAQEKKVLNKQHTKLRTGSGVIRITFNDDKKIMVNTANMTILDITELNFNPKDFSIKDFEKGKVAMYINFIFDKDCDNAKFKKEISDLFTEETEC